MNRVLLALVLALAACAAPGQVEVPDEPTVFADFGFGSAIVAGGWVPITVAVQALDEPLSGYVELSFIAGGERVDHVAPFAAAPQSSALVPMTVHLPWWTDTITLGAVDEKQGRVANITYKSNPGPTDARLPALTRSARLVVSVTPRLPAGLVADAVKTPEGKGLDLTPVNVTADRLPPNRLAYESVELLVVDPANLAGADPRSIEAILRWTASGGRLLILADRPGSEWSRWLAATPATADIDVGTLTELDLAGNALSGRPIELGRIAAAAGWTSLATDNAGRTIAARGPLAFGWLTLASYDPLVFEQDEDQPHIERLALNDADDGEELLVSMTSTFGRYYLGEDRAVGKDWLIYQTIDAVATSDPPGSGGFVLIAAVPLALAVLLGPIDFFLLGRLRRRQLAWFSAFVWIALVGGVALVVPRLLQASSSDIGTVAASDLILPNLAMQRDAGPNTAAEIQPTLAGWSAGASVLFHGSQTPFTLESPEPHAWRPLDSGNTGLAALSGALFRQSPAGPGLAAAAAVEPVRIPARVWSLATMHNHGPASQTFGVALTANDDAAQTEFTLQLTGLPEGAIVRAGRITHEGREHTLVDASQTPLRFAFGTRGDGFDFEGDVSGSIQAALAVLAGEPRRRNAAINAMIDAGWARIDLLIENPPALPTFTTTDPSAQTGYALYRVLTPMPEPRP